MPPFTQEDSLHGRERGGNLKGSCCPPRRVGSSHSPLGLQHIRRPSHPMTGGVPHEGRAGFASRECIMTMGAGQAGVPTSRNDRTGTFTHPPDFCAWGQLHLHPMRREAPSRRPVLIRVPDHHLARPPKTLDLPQPDSDRLLNPQHRVGQPWHRTRLPGAAGGLRHGEQPPASAWAFCPSFPGTGVPSAAQPVRRWAEEAPPGYQAEHPKSAQRAVPRCYQMDPCELAASR